MMTKSVSGDVEPLSVAPKKACIVIDCSMTRLYELLNAGEIKSYRDGKARKIVVASLQAYVERQVAAEANKPREGWTDKATKARIAKAAYERLSGHGQTKDRRR